MKIYHQLIDQTLDSARSNGLARTTRGEKGQDEQIIKTDVFLDKHVPPKLRELGVSRCNNIYGYIGDETQLIDIQTGNTCSVTSKASEIGQTLLQIEVDPIHCWVSDLDLYDAVKHASDDTNRKRAATKYWNSLQPFSHYNGSIRRPEVMITVDIPPSQLKEIHKSISSR